MPSPVVSRKRKADALEADATLDVPPRTPAPDDDSPAHLPAPCLAAVLNFMRYADVRQCMLAGKMMAVEAAGHVETLNITKASELDAPSARRFRSASEVNVLCLVSETDAEDDREDRQYPPDQISMETVTRVVPFLSSFPNLERIFLGGLFLEGAVWERYQYNHDECIDPRDHQAIFKALIQNIIGGFQSRTLTQILELDGILDSGQLQCADADDDADDGRENPDHPCQFCRHLLSSFPLHLLLEPVSRYHAFCVSRVDRIQALLRRDGAEAALRSTGGAEMLLECLSDVIPHDYIYSETEADEAFIKKMRDQGAKFHVSIDMNWDRSGWKSLNDFRDLIKSSLC